MYLNRSVKSLTNIKIKANLWIICFFYLAKFILKMNKGTVKFFNETKGFGFIKDADSNKEYFVHSSGIKDSISENDEVTFDLQEGKKGLNAVNVNLA